MTALDVGLCPSCREPIEYGGDVVAARVAGRIREYHRECIDEARPSDIPTAVGRRIEAILDRETRR